MTCRFALLYIYRVNGQLGLKFMTVRIIWNVAILLLRILYVDQYYAFGIETLVPSKEDTNSGQIMSNR